MTSPANPDEVVMTRPVTPARRGKGTSAAERDARRGKAVALALSGLSYEVVARETGYSSAESAYRAVRRALSSVVTANVDELRRKHSAQLDRLLAATWQSALRGDPAALREARKLLDSKARLLGLNAPIQVEDVSNVDAEIAALRTALAADIGPDGVYHVEGLDDLERAS